MTTWLTASDEKGKVHGQSGEPGGKLWNAGCDHTGVPELRAGEPRKRERKKWEKVGKVAKRKKEGKGYMERKLYMN